MLLGSKHALINLMAPLLCCGIANAQSGGVLCGLPGSAPDCANVRVATTSSPSVKASSAVTYSNSQLTIHARNATMKELLHAVSAQTGATVEFPSGSAAELVSLDAGPGPIREVIASLLNGSRFNYVMLGSAEDPGTLTRLILSDAHTSVIASGAPPQVAQGAPQPALYGQAFNASSDGESAEEETPAPVPTPAVSASAAVAGADPAQASGKSQAEILSDLQKEFMRKLHEQQAAQPTQ